MKLKYTLLVITSLVIGICQSQEQHNCSLENPITIAHDRCGYVEVPNNWDNKNDGNTRIAYAVIQSKSENRKEDPLIFLQGGPGGSVLPYANVFAGLAIDPDRDFIMYDQRGIGFSDEICSGLSLTFLEVMASDIALDKEDEALLKLSSDCIKSLNNTNFKTAFGSYQSARDLEALRQHLGYKQLNIFGGSYGTRLGLKYMEMYPTSIRSSILSGLFSPETRLYENIYTNLNRSLEQLFESCNSDTNCKAKYPNLRKNFKSVCENLDTKGQTFSIQNNDFVINKQDFLLLIQQMLYNRNTIANVPSFIMAFSTNNVEAIQNGILAFASRLGVINVAAYWSVNLKDEGAFKNKTLVSNDEKKYPYLANGVSLFASDPDVLKFWPSKDTSYTKMKAVISEIPTLLISGEWDPITPPSNGKQVAKSLKHSIHVIFPSEGHCPMNACFFQMAVAFLNNPMQQVDTSCVRVNPIAFD
ncbi:alpha/beta hydrolase [Psychroserpens sp. SPM9]|uniref:alpha/beta hydrolase n=1 Tax=Psychroserpens sp. SPM9 TaxID=2975598 RepID=UPI0021A53E1D|nr:alpha/beta hydrolase [Psychroserpens sp. SPM9]MDG5491268.1 alpha/beta hydrolase [Psychroserpens sp. SPM9]